MSDTTDKVSGIKALVKETVIITYRQDNVRKLKVILAESKSYNAWIDNNILHIEDSLDNDLYAMLDIEDIIHLVTSEDEDSDSNVNAFLKWYVDTFSTVANS